MNGRVVAYCALTVTAASFAGNTIVGRAVIDELPPMGLAFWRAFGAFLIVAPFGAAGVWRSRREIVAAWKLLFVLGVLGMTAFSVFVFTGLHHTEAINATLIQGTLPLNIVVASLVVLGQAISPRQGLGLVVGGIGFAAIVLRGEIENLAGFVFNPGDALIWAGVFCYALFSILLPRRPAALGLTAFITVFFFMASVTTLPFHLWEIARGEAMPLSWTALWAAGFIALFSSLLALYLWTTAVERVGARTAGYFIYLTPAFGAAAAVVLLGEDAGWFHLAGIALIFAGIWLATTARSAGSVG